MDMPPVAFFVYNRRSTTERVFERIASARPRTLLIVADGPRPDVSEDAARCDAVLSLVSHPGWDCDVRVNRAPANLGFKKRISTGLDWVFSQFEEAIILEDDCLPDPSFFPFCAELLERYRHDPRVMMITGCNLQFGRRRGASSYYFSQCVGTWGWASWRRALHHFDPEIPAWPLLRGGGLLKSIWQNDSIASYWRDRLDEVHDGRVDAWDYQWALAMWLRGGWQIAPNSNLISYIGCLPDTTHTTDMTASYCNVPTSPMAFPLQHPLAQARDVAADLFEFYRGFLNMSDVDADALSVAPESGTHRHEVLASTPQEGR